MLTGLLMTFCRWIIPPCIAAGVTIGLLTPVIRDLKEVLPPGFSLRHPPAAAPDLGKQIESLIGAE
jgi:hypothetical protein